MAKLDALKEKIGGLKQKLTEKFHSIPLFQKILKKEEVKKGADPHSIGVIYQSGGVFTRLQVILVFLLAAAAVASLGVVAAKIKGRHHAKSENEKLAADYSQGLEAMKRKMEDNASTLSLGQFVISAYVGEDKTASMGLDIWIRVSDVEAANFVQGHEIVLRDKSMDALNEIYMQKVNLLTEQGKETGKRKIRDFLNRAMPTGKVEEVFFHNIIVQ